MSNCDMELVKLCSFSAPIPACDLTDPLNPKPVMFVGVIDAGGNLIPTTSTAYPSPVSGFTGDGAGFIRSYFTDAAGVALTAAPTAYSFSGECAASAPQADFETGCLVDADPTIAPLPVRYEFMVNADGSVTQVLTDLMTGLVIVPTATQHFDENCDRYNVVSSPFCVRDSATGAILRQVNSVSIFDNETGLLVGTPVVYNATTGAIDTLAATEVLGSCDVYPPLVFIGCISDGTTRTPVRQLVPVVNGLPNFAGASYVDPTTGAAVPLGTGTYADGKCKSPCLTCPA